MPGGLGVPAAVRATWPKMNTVDPELQGPLAPAIVGILGVIATIVVVARYVSRFRLQANAGFDDWVFLAAMPGALGLIIGVILGTSTLHSNIHIWDMQKQYIAPMRKLQLANYVCYTWSTCLIKLSVLLFYRRLTSKSISPKFVYALWTTMGANVVFFLISVVVVCFPCYPMSTYFTTYWKASYLAEHPADTWHCLDEGKAVYYISLGGVVLDFITTILPFTLFLKLRMPKRQKIAMCLTFFGGFIVCGAGVARTWTVYLVYFETYDMPWHNYWFWLATGIEVCTALICASAPSLKFYFRRYLDVPDRRPSTTTNCTSTHSPSTVPFNDTTSADSKRRLLFGSTRKSSSWSTTATEISFLSSITSSQNRDPRTLSPMPKSPLDAEAGYFSVLSEKNGRGAAQHYVPPSIAGAFHAAAALPTDEILQLEGDIVGNWYARSAHEQEDELRAMGILAKGKEVDVDVAKAVGEHPVFYPWQEKAESPPAETKSPRMEDWEEVGLGGR